MSITFKQWLEAVQQPEPVKQEPEKDGDCLGAMATYDMPDSENLPPTKPKKSARQKRLLLAASDTSPKFPRNATF